MNVSVIIPVYKAEQFVNTAVASALAHDEVKEIILIEDGSPDNSFEICQQLEKAHERVKLLRHAGGVNKGAGASRNLGLENANQEFVCFLDADDQMTASRFAVEKKMFLDHHEVDGVYGSTGTQYYDRIGEKEWNEKGYDETHLDRINKPVPPEILFDYLTGFKNEDGYSGHFTIDALTLRRASFRSHNIQFDEELRLHQDSAFIWQCAYYLNLYPGDLEEPIAIRGVHGGNRFIHHRDLNDSRSRLFYVLMKWSEAEDLDHTYKQYFKASYHYFRLAKNSFLVSFPQTVFYCLTSKHFRNLFLNHLYTRLMKFLK